MRQSTNYFWFQMISVSLLLIVSSIQFSPIVSAEDDNLIQTWQDGWKYHKTLTLPIDTKEKQAVFQPIDMHITFKYPCWGVNETYHSIRVCCWDTKNWNELEVQVYNIEKTDDTTISSCNIVFLIPSFASGDESYVLFYDDTIKQAPDYIDHVELYDKYYYFEPISGISVEGDYYEIKEDDFIVYGVGQKGRVLNRHLSQIAIRMKPETKKFDMLKTDLLASFCFSYQQGPDEADEVASDQELIAKEILVDGNLMVRFVIVSKSSNDAVVTSNVYTYYYQPLEDKRISVHVNHEVQKEVTVSGIKNVDGRFGTIISYHSKSPSVKKMVFGDILPFLYVSTDEGVQEYSLEQDPESSTREWIISYEDDCDLGSEAWIAYGNGESGKTHGLIFSSNLGIIQNASDERDGIEVKLAEKEYLDVIGAEVDYASIGFGRNAYEPYQPHDLIIDKGLKASFDVEFFTTYSGGYQKIQEESSFFQKLVKFRDLEISNGELNQNIYTLTVIPHLFGRIFSFPYLTNLTGRSLPVITGELYQNETLIAETIVTRPIIGIQTLRFPKLAPGNYQVKLYRMYSVNEKSYIGFGTINLVNDANLHVYCTWEQDINVITLDQFGNGVSNVTYEVWQGPFIISSVDSKSFPKTTIPVPFNLFKSYVTTDLKNASAEDLFQKGQPYIVKGFFKGFKIFNTSLSVLFPSAEVTLPIHDVIIEVVDALGLPPDVNVIPTITSEEMIDSTGLNPSVILESGRYLYSNIPEAMYQVQVSFGGHISKKTFSVPESGPIIPLQFSTTQSLDIQVLSSRGELIETQSVNVRILRDNKEIKFTNVNQRIVIPPGTYVLSLFEGNRLIGSEIIELNSDKTIPIVTSIPSTVFLLVTFSSVILLAEVMLFFYFRKISLNTALKLVIFGVVLIGLMQPWWAFYGISDDGSVMKSSEMFLYPSTMIEEYEIEGSSYLSLATIPEVFTDFVQTLLFIILGGIALLVSSFIPNLLLKKRFEFALMASGFIFMILVATAFLFGMGQIAQLSLGSLQGTANIPVSPPYAEELIVSASWGLGPGFYIVFFGASIAVIAGILDFMKKRKLLFIFRKNNSKKKQK